MKYDSFISSPNANWIPSINLDIHETFARFDGFYGPDEYLFVPQFADPSIPHIVCIPRTPRTEADDLCGHEHMFSALKDSDIEDAYPTSGKPMSDKLVRIRGLMLTNLLHSIDTMKTRGSALLTFLRQHNPRHAQHTPQVEELINRMRRNYARLETIQSTLHSTKFLYADICRAWLEIAGLDNWYRKFHQPAQQFTVEPATSTSHVVGAYATDEGTVAAFLRMGVPVWLLQRYNTFGKQIIRSESRLTSVAELGPLDDNLRPRPGFIFKGSYKPTASRYHAIRYHSRVFFTTPDAFSINAITAANIPGWMSDTPAFPEGTRQVGKYMSARRNESNRARTYMPAHIYHLDINSDKFKFSRCPCKN